MPLPDELRPPEVLSMTMDYLLNNIMDTGGSGKWGDWYDFLWNRTRSIRKVGWLYEYLLSITRIFIAFGCYVSMYYIRARFIF